MEIEIEIEKEVETALTESKVSLGAGMRVSVMMFAS